MKWIETELRVRFDEVDAYGVVFYANYLRYFEVGRMAMLRAYGIHPSTFPALGLFVPVVRAQIDYKRPARMEEEIVVRATVLPPRVAAITCRFEIVAKEGRAVLVQGETTQVFQKLDGTTLYRFPETIRPNLERMLADLAEGEAPSLPPGAERRRR